MPRPGSHLALAIALGLLATAGPVSTQTATRVPANALQLQAAIDAAIRSGIAYLERQHDDGMWVYRRAPFVRGPGGRAHGDDDDSGGLTALALYALAAAGVAADEPVMRQGLGWCRKHPHPFAGGRRGTYAASLLVLALCRIDAVAHKSWIHELARRIGAAQLQNGMWSYELVARPRPAVAKPNPSQRDRSWSWLSTGDGSNTQFAVMALWTAQATAQFRVPSRVWKRVRDYHERAQHENGGFSYKAPRPGQRPGPLVPAWMFDPSPAMTAAGLVAYTCASAGLNGGVRGLAKARRSKVAKAGMDAFRSEHPRWESLLHDYYFAYSVERVGTLFGLPPSEWYDEVARRLVARQAPDGRWRSARGRFVAAYGDHQQVYETALALLCLTQATRHPLTPRRPGK